MFWLQIDTLLIWAGQRNSHCVWSWHILLYHVLTAECPKPQVEGNVVLTTDALLMNDFPEGGEATFECANGYLKEQGSERITCTSGKWSTLKLTCKSMRQNSSNFLSFSVKCDFYCMFDLFTVWLFVAGVNLARWLFISEKDCGAPRKMPHLTYEFKEGTLFGASARAICDKGWVCFIMYLMYHQSMLEWFCQKIQCQTTTPPTTSNNVYIN